MSSIFLLRWLEFLGTILRWLEVNFATRNIIRKMHICSIYAALQRICKETCIIFGINRTWLKKLLKADWWLMMKIMVKALDSQSRSPVFKNHWVAPRSTQPFILLRSIKWAPGISGNWMVKSKLPPRSGCSLEAVESHP